MCFLKLIGCDNGKVGSYAALVKERNDTAHTNGNIFFSTPAALDTKIREILRVVDEIQTHSKPLIEHAYRDFLLQSHDPDEREYSDTGDQIREILIHKNYFSQKDVDICLVYNLSAHSDHSNFKNIGELHQSLQDIYSDSETESVS